jgi:uncharacterized protein YuzE
MFDIGRRGGRNNCLRESEGEFKLDGRMRRRLLLAGSVRKSHMCGTKTKDTRLLRSRPERGITIVSNVATCTMKRAKAIRHWFGDSYQAATTKNENESDVEDSIEYELDSDGEIVDLTIFGQARGLRLPTAKQYLRYSNSTPFLGIWSES